MTEKREKRNPRVSLLFMVIPPRLERGTYCLEGSCSIQLSYGTNLFAVLRVQR